MGVCFNSREFVFRGIDAKSPATVIFAPVCVVRNFIFVPILSSTTFPSLSTPRTIVSTAVSLMTMDGSGPASIATSEMEQRMEMEDARCNYRQHVSMDTICLNCQQRTCKHKLMGFVRSCLARGRNVLDQRPGTWSENAKSPFD